MGLEPLNNKDFDIFDDYDPEVLKNMIAMFQAQAAELANPEKCSLDEVISMINEEADNVMNANGLVCDIEMSDGFEDFVGSLYNAFNEIYAQYGDEKVYTETIIASFYGTAYVSVLKKRDDADSSVSDFELLKNNVNIAEITANAEAVLELDAAANENIDLWNMVYNYSISAVTDIRKVEADAEKIKASIIAGVRACEMAVKYVNRK